MERKFEKAVVGAFEPLVNGHPKYHRVRIFFKDDAEAEWHIYQSKGQRYWVTQNCKGRYESGLKLFQKILAEHDNMSSLDHTMFLYDVEKGDGPEELNFALTWVFDSLESWDMLYIHFRGGKSTDNFWLVINGSFTWFAHPPSPYLVYDHSTTRDEFPTPMLKTKAELKAFFGNHERRRIITYVERVRIWHAH